MLTALRTKLQKDDEGFTLIELMVVVLIIAILLAIAIPTFLRAQDSAKDKSAQSDLRNAMTAIRTLATDAGGQFDDITLGELQAAEPNITFAATNTGQGVIVSEDTPASGTNSATEIVLWIESEAGNFHAMATDETGKVVTCEDVADAAAAAACTTATPTTSTTV